MTLRTIAIIVLAVIFGVAAAVGVNVLIQQQQQQRTVTAAVETVPVVVAAVDIPRGVTVAPAQFKTRDWPKHLLPPGAMTRVEDVRERAAVVPMVKDEVVLENKLSPKESGRGLAAIIPPGMRAFTIHTPHVASHVAGFILPGNKVDVLFTTTTDDPRTGGAVTTTLLQNLEILAVDQRLNPPNENKVPTVQSVTLLVTPDQAAKLGLGLNRGSLQLALRNTEDEAPAITKPATLAGLIFYQEKPPLTEKGMELLAQLAKTFGERKKVSPELLAREPERVRQFLEIRTLRGVYTGTVQVEQPEVLLAGGRGE